MGGDAAGQPRQRAVRVPRHDPIAVGGRQDRARRLDRRPAGRGVPRRLRGHQGALIAFTKSLAVELAPRITVNCVAPGWVDTEMAAQPYGRDGGRARLEIERTIPLGRVASPEDVAGPIVFLCSELARHITGEILNVNGGSVLCG